LAGLLVHGDAAIGWPRACLWLVQMANLEIGYKNMVHVVGKKKKKEKKKKQKNIKKKPYIIV